MSAWIVDRVHIDALVQALAEGEIVTDVHPDEIGRILWRENVKSIHYRYPDTARNDSHYPGPHDFVQAWADDYTYTRPAEALSKDSLLKQAHCYNYQSCEDPDFERSVAYGWIVTLQESLQRAGVTSATVAYQTAPWGLDPVTV